MKMATTPASACGFCRGPYTYFLDLWASGPGRLSVRRVRTSGRSDTPASLQAASISFLRGSRESKIRSLSAPDSLPRSIYSSTKPPCCVSCS